MRKKDKSRKDRIVNIIKFAVVILMITLFVWFLVVSPMIEFRGNEDKLEEAARRYFELNSDKLPTGSRVKTVTLNELYKGSYLKEDFYSPYTKKVCSITDSWVKVRRENDGYKYYVFLDCGVLKSGIDHEGPEIKLNGDKEMSLGIGEEYKELGVKSIVDNSDGKMKSSDVTIKGKVDTSKIGTYSVTYSASDKLGNKSVVTREVKVVKTLNSVVKKDLGNNNNYTGNPEKNYIRLSNMIYRLYGINDKNDIIIVADQDIANVNYTKIDKWLEYYYDNLSSAHKKMIVKNRFCNMTLTDTTLDTTECSAYTKEKNIYVPAVSDINKAQAGEDNFMKTDTISWTGNQKDNKESYVTRYGLLGEDFSQSFMGFDKTDNYGVRPMMVISGKSLITGGSGTYLDPYVFGDTKKGKNGSLLNERGVGEYVEDGNMLYRIVSIEDDGTTKVISDLTIGNNRDETNIYPNPDSSKITYNPKDKGSVAYFINNRASEYVNTENFVNHTIEVPIYKNKIVYGEEVETKKYKAKLSAPNMYEMFSAKTTRSYNGISYSYWLVNSSKKDNIAGVITEIGVPINGKVEAYDSYGVRIVAFFKKDKTINSGDGTVSSPYKIN